MVEFDIMYGEGVSKTGELIDLGVKAGVVEKSGAWFSYDSQRIGQGRENAKTFLKDNPDIAAKIEAAVRAELRHRSPRRSWPARATTRTRTTTRPRRPERQFEVRSSPRKRGPRSDKNWILAGACPAQAVTGMSGAGLVEM